MRYLSPRSLFIAAAAAVLFAIPASAQNGPPADAPPPDRQVSDESRPNLLKELALTREQIRQIRRMNQARRSLMEEASRRLREANRALDMAIYGDTLSEDDVAARLKEFQLAQAEVAKLRFRGELELRKLLTAEQLGKFRQLRERFGRGRERRQNRRRNLPPGQRPIDRLRQLPRRGNQV